MVPVGVSWCASFRGEDEQAVTIAQVHCGCGVVWCWPLLAPLVVSRSKGLPSHIPPTLPPFERNSSIVLRFQSFRSAIIPPLLWMPTLSATLLRARFFLV